MFLPFSLTHDATLLPPTFCADGDKGRRLIDSLPETSDPKQQRLNVLLPIAFHIQEPKRGDLLHLGGLDCRASEFHNVARPLRGHAVLHILKFEYRSAELPLTVAMKFQDRAPSSWG